MSGTRSLAVSVKGRVQGVNYRNFTVTAARELGVKGWVRNCEDGSVEAVLHGPGEALSTLVGVMREGPREARVDALDVRSTDAGAAGEAPPEAYVF